MNAGERIQKIVSKNWFLKEPLLFNVWLTHVLKENNSISSIRVGDGRIEYNQNFIDSLNNKELEEIMKFEAVRMILKHPYERKKEVAPIAYLDSNITLKEYLSTSLPVPTAKDIFNDPDMVRQYFELYYEKLLALKISVNQKI